MTDERPVSFPPGETEYVETFVRTHYADGTHTDSAPEPAQSTASALDQLKRMLAGIERTKGAPSVRMQRTVKVVASEWQEVAPTSEPDPSEVIVYEQADPNDYCQRQLCGHARGFHGAPPEDDDACERCDNRQKCPGFVAKRVPGDG